MYLFTVIITLLCVLSLEAFFPTITVKVLSWIALRERAIIKKISDEIKTHT